MSRRLTIRGAPDDAAMRLENVGRTRGRSIEPTFRLRCLQRYVTWSDEELVAFSEALESQRRGDVETRRC